MRERLQIASKKLLHGSVWRFKSRQAPPARVEVLHQDGQSVVYCCHGPAYIEPVNGFVITEAGQILEDALVPNFFYAKRPFRALDVPSPFDFDREVKAPRDTIVRDTVLHIRHPWEWNYYHFYFDVLGKLELLDHAGISTDHPIALGKFADDVSFVRPLIGRGPFARHEWLTPTAQYIKADRIIFCRTYRPYRARIQYINRELGVEYDPGAPDNDSRIFIERTGMRKLGNLEEIRPILDRYGFRPVDPSQMTMDQQIETFSKARYVIATHGAGTTNILFRNDRPMSLLELHSDWMNFDHKRMCTEMGHYWDDLLCERPAGSHKASDFTVVPHEMEEKIRAMLAAGAAHPPQPTALAVQL